MMFNTIKSLARNISYVLSVYAFAYQNIYLERNDLATAYAAGDNQYRFWPFDRYMYMEQRIALRERLNAMSYEEICDEIDRIELSDHPYMMPEESDIYHEIAMSKFDEWNAQENIKHIQCLENENSRLWALVDDLQIENVNLQDHCSNLAEDLEIEKATSQINNEQADYEIARLREKARSYFDKSRSYHMRLLDAGEQIEEMQKTIDELKATIAKLQANNKAMEKNLAVPMQAWKPYVSETPIQLARHEAIVRMANSDAIKHLKDRYAAYKAMWKKADQLAPCDWDEDPDGYLECERLFDIAETLSIGYIPRNNVKYPVGQCRVKRDEAYRETAQDMWDYAGYNMETYC